MSHERLGKRGRLFTWNVVACGVLACCAMSIVCADDEVLLKNGGKILGRLIPPASSNASEVRIGTTDGITVTLAEEEVKDTKLIGPAAEEYGKQLALTPDTTEGHMRLADWCVKNGAVSRQRIHLQRVLEMDPDHAEARKKLGYRRMVDGTWGTTEDEMRAQGKVYYKGRWITTQQRDLLLSKKMDKLEENKYSKLISQWKKDLGTRKDEEAKANFRTLVSPQAVPGLLSAWKTERRLRAKQVYVLTLGRIGSIEAKNFLQVVAVDDPSEDLRMAAIDELRRFQDKAVTEYLISRLSPKKSLNPHINRAAAALGEIGDTTAIPALIEALSTTHVYTVSQGSSPGQMSSTFGTGSTGGSSFSAGGKAKSIRKLQQNQGVLNALEKMTGVNFLYEKEAWAAWLRNNPVTPR